MKLCSRDLAVLALVFTSQLSYDASAASGTKSNADVLKVLIVDGQNNHNWELTTPIMERFYNECPRFEATVATTPGKGEDMAGFRPQFAKYDAVVSNYNGASWPRETQIEFQAFVHGGGGFVSVHAADNSFSDWPEYNEMIGLGGWGGRKKSAGPYLYFKDGERVLDAESAGSGGGHGPQHKFHVVTREPEHPIMQGLPSSWLHTKDELYERLRGPAKNVTILATAFASPDKRGSGRDEPMLMTINYGEGRVFHTTLGHVDYSMHCVGFRETLLRGTEWAATGTVTLPIPSEFPTADKASPIRSK
ncbi:MAG: ThuA domain-containing protein [Planctomycetota bacterium]